MRSSSSSASLRTAHVKLLSEGKLAEAEKVGGITDTEASELANLTGQESFQKTRAAAATARSLITAFDAFLASINTVPQGGGYAPLMGAVLREQAHAGGDETYLLYVEVTAAGGEVIQ